MKKFLDRVDAGRQLAHKLSEYKNQHDVIVLGLPRGGVVLAAEVARALNLPLDIVVPRKIGAPMQPELAIGAVTQDGAVLYNDELMQQFNITKEMLKPFVNVQKREAERRLKLYRGNRPPLDLTNKKVIIVDDGIATGATVCAAVLSVAQMGAREIIVAVPVAASDTLCDLEYNIEKVIALEKPTVFPGVGYFYKQFPQVTDQEVIKLMST